MAEDSRVHHGPTCGRMRRPHAGMRTLTAMQFKGYTLNSFQILAAKAIAGGKNVLLAAPTGAGKTLVAEYAIEEAVRSGRRAIYTSPIKALSNQKYRDFKTAGLDVGLMTGDLTLEAQAPVVIMTTEIFRNSVFEDPRRFDTVDFVIFDEIHFLDDPERGTVWEESLIFAPPHVRFIGLSATISNLDQFGKWIDSIRPHGLEVIRHDRRPVPLEHRLFHLDAGFFQLAQRKRAMQLKKRAAVKDRGARRKGTDRDRAPRRNTAVATQKVLDQLQEEGLLPVLFFCFSRKECEIKADRNMHRDLLAPHDRKRINTLFDDVCARFELKPEKDPPLAEIHRRAMRGVGYHHAGMLPIHKEVVERLFTSGLLKLLFTTETFALGINMPARTVVFDSLRKFDGVSFDYMRTRDYMQMAGRAGRQGIDLQGLVISILDDDDLQDAPLPALFGDRVEPITSRFNLSYSTILNLYVRMGDALEDAYDQSFAAFQAAGSSQRSRQLRREEARRTLRARINVLKETWFIDEQGLLPRGRVAQQINGYEIQVTELLFDGVLDELDIHQLSCLFAALVHEERRGEEGGAIRGRAILGPALPRIDRALRQFVVAESNQGLPATIKMPDFGVVPAVHAWSRGASTGELQRMLGSDGGDVIRTMRMVIQMMRQLRTALSGDYPLIHRLAEAIVAVNRDEVDAKRQFELG